MCFVVSLFGLFFYFLFVHFYLFLRFKTTQLKRLWQHLYTLHFPDLHRHKPHQTLHGNRTYCRFIEFGIPVRKSFTTRSTNITYISKMHVTCLWDLELTKFDAKSTTISGSLFCFLINELMLAFVLRSIHSPTLKQL